VISPPGRGDLYPGRLPPLRAQWSRLPAGVRAATIAVPLAIVAVVGAVDLRAGATMAVLLLGAAGATVVYAKNRTDRHNAAVDRGDVRTVADPHFRPATVDDIPQELLARVGELQEERQPPGRVVRFEGGWIVRRRNPRDVAVVIGDDGGWARFDPRTVTDLWAVAEYRAGRGRDG
jgi:hypothetical protein